MPSRFRLNLKESDAEGLLALLRAAKFERLARRLARAMGLEQKMSRRDGAGLDQMELPMENQEAHGEEVR